MSSLWVKLHFSFEQFKIEKVGIMLFKEILWICQLKYLMKIQYFMANVQNSVFWAIKDKVKKFFKFFYDYSSKMYVIEND